MHDMMGMMDEDDDKGRDFKKSEHAEPSAKEAMEGRLGEIDKLVMLLLANKMSTPPSPMGQMGPMGMPPMAPPPMGPPGMGSNSLLPPNQSPGAIPSAAGSISGPNPMLMQQLQAARGLV